MEKIIVPLKDLPPPEERAPVEKELKTLSFTALLDMAIRKRFGIGPNKKIKSFRRKKAAFRQIPNPRAGELVTVGQSLYEIKANGEWRFKEKSI